jgi:hypothetical protein
MGYPFTFAIFISLGIGFLKIQYDNPPKGIDKIKTHIIEVHFLISFLKMYIMAHPFWNAFFHKKYIC